MIVMFPSEVEQKIKEKAAQKGLDTQTYLIKLVQSDTGSKIAFDHPNGQDDDYDSEAGNRSIEAMLTLSSEEREAMRNRVLAKSRSPLPLKEGQSIFEIIPPIRGDETEEEFYQAVERMS